MARPSPRLRGWWRVFGHPTDEWASAVIVSALQGGPDATRPDPYTDRDEHARQSNAGTHLYTESCAFCVEEYVKGSGSDEDIAW